MNPEEKELYAQVNNNYLKRKSPEWGLIMDTAEFNNARAKALKDKAKDKGASYAVPEYPQDKTAGVFDNLMKSDTERLNDFYQKARDAQARWNAIANNTKTPAELRRNTAIGAGLGGLLGAGLGYAAGDGTGALLGAAAGLGLGTAGGYNFNNIRANLGLMGKDTIASSDTPWLKPYLQDKLASSLQSSTESCEDKTAASLSDLFIGGWKSQDGTKRPSGMGMATSGLLAGAADDVYERRRAKGRGALRSALGYLNAPMGAVAGGVAGAPLAPFTLGMSIPIGAATGAAAQTSLADSDSPYVHVLPTLGGAGIGALLGAGIGAGVNTRPGKVNTEGAIGGGLIGAGVGGLGGYALSRLVN